MRGTVKREENREQRNLKKKDELFFSKRSCVWYRDQGGRILKDLLLEKKKKEQGVLPLKKEGLMISQLTAANTRNC